MSEEAKLVQVRRGVLRMISPKRKRTLKRRGVPVWWDQDLRSWVWSRTPTAQESGDA